MALTDKRKRFIEEYLIDFNGTQAAIRAGYSESTARQQAEQMLKDPDVMDLVKEGKEEIKEYTHLTKLDKLKLLESIMAGENKNLTIKAIEVHNKMTGDNEAEKIDVKDDRVNINYNKPKK